MIPDVIVVSNKSEIQVAPQVCDLEGFSQCHKIILTCQDASAAVNRNYGLKQAESTIVVMIDDDISGFYDGWIDDLVEPLLRDDQVIYSSANLLNRDGTPGAMMFRGNDAEEWTTVPRAPTACIAFRNDGVMFDENFIGSGFEDDAFCAELAERFPYGKFVVANKCKMVHDNIQCNQGGKYFEHNEKYFNNTYKREGRYHGIPTILHWIWLGPEKEHVPILLKMWKEMNPNFKVMVHNGKEELLPVFDDIYDSIEGDHSFEKKSDLIRLSVLRRYGGWYFDCDFIPVNPILEITKKYSPQNGLMLARRNDALIANGFMAAKHESSALELWIDHIVNRSKKYGNSFTKGWSSFGPGAATWLWNDEAAPHFITGKKPTIIEQKRFFRYDEDDSGISNIMALYNNIKTGGCNFEGLEDCFAVHMHAKGGSVDELERTNRKYRTQYQAGNSGIYDLYRESEGV